MPVSYFALGEDAGKQIVKCCSPVCQYVRAKPAKTLTTPAWFILGGELVVSQENKNDKQQIPEPSGPHPIAGGLFFGNDGKKCRFCRWFFAVYRRGLTPFFFLVNFNKQ